MSDTISSDELTELIATCVVKVDGETRGSGFFVDSDLVLTCRHVAGVVDAEVTVRPSSGEGSRSGRVIAISDRDQEDVALVRLDPQGPGEVTQPALRLALAPLPPNGVALAPGFPSHVDANNKVVTDVGLTYVRLPFAVEWSGPQPRWIRVADGTEVAPGLSGAAALVRTESGWCVAGLVRYNRPGSTGLAGGGVTALAAVAPLLTEVQALIDQPPPAVTQWTTLVNRDAGLSVLANPDRQRLELTVAGDATGWQVTRPGSAPEAGMTVSMLAQRAGDGVVRAVFGWVSGRRPAGPEDVRHRGALIGTALTAGSGHQIQALQQLRAPFDVRLGIDQACELRDVPWELAHLPGADDPLSTAVGNSMTRIVPGSPERPPNRAPEGVQFLAVIPGKNLDEAWNPWKGKLDRMARYDLVKADLFPDELNEAIASHPYTVVHYQGEVRLTARGAELVIDTRTKGQLHPVRLLAERAAQTGASILVIEARDRGNGGPLPPPSAYVDLLETEIEAVIVTQYLVSDFALGTFNRTFYGELSKGRRFDAAVQEARRSVRENATGETDQGAFGAFVAITDVGGGPFLFAPDVEADSDPSPAGRPRFQRSTAPATGKDASKVAG